MVLHRVFRARHVQTKTASAVRCDMVLRRVRDIFRQTCNTSPPQGVLSWVLPQPHKADTYTYTYTYIYICIYIYTYMYMYHYIIVTALLSVLCVTCVIIMNSDDDTSRGRSRGPRLRSRAVATRGSTSGPGVSPIKGNPLQRKPLRKGHILLRGIHRKRKSLVMQGARR